MSVPLAFLGIVIVWTTTPLAIKWSGEDVGFLFGVSMRMFIALLFSLLFIMVLRKAFPWDRKSIHVYLAIGIPLYLAMIFVYWGAQFIPSGLVSVMFGLTPLFTGLLATFWLSESSFTLPKTSGMLLGFVGLIVIFYQGFDVGQTMIMGMIAVLTAVFFHSFGTVWVKQVASDLPVFIANTGGLVVASILYILSWFLLGEDIPLSVPMSAAYSITYLAIFGSVFGAILFYYALKHVSASSMGLLPLITPVTCLLFGQWFNNEVITNATMIGTSIILSGLLVYQWSALVNRAAGRISSDVEPVLESQQNEK